jgi:hypothetical protein
LVNRVRAAGVLLGGALCSLAGIGGLQAQPVYVAPGYVAPGYFEPGLPPYAIMSIVRSTGLTPLTRPMRRGPNYVLVAVDRSGQQMRVVVDARRGDIVNMRPALAAAPPAYGAYGPGSYGQYGTPAYGSPLYGAPPPYGQTPALPEPPVTAAPPPESASPPTTVPFASRSLAPRANADAAPPTAPLHGNPKLANAPAGVVTVPDPPAPPLPRRRPAVAASGAGEATAATPPTRPEHPATPATRAPTGPADPAQIE